MKLEAAMIHGATLFRSDQIRVSGSSIMLKLYSLLLMELIFLLIVCREPVDQQNSEFVDVLKHQLHCLISQSDYQREI